MSDPFMGEIRMFAGTYAPRGWALCNGQLLAISSNSALFSLLGTNYGGDGVTTFALPNLQSRSPVGTGTGGGLTNVQLGQVGGVESTTLTTLNMPAHNHAATGTASISVGGTPSNPALAPTATNNILGGSIGGTPAAAAIWSDQLSGPVNMGNQSTVSVTVQNSGGSQPVALRNPYLGMNFIIALEGIYPSRN